MVCTWGGAVPDDTILMILSKIRYLLDTISAHLRAEMWSELVDWASEWPLAVRLWRFGAQKYGHRGSNCPRYTHTGVVATTTRISTALRTLRATSLLCSHAALGAANVRCGALVDAKSAYGVVGSRQWSLSCPTNTFCGSITHILAQQASQSGAVGCSIRESHPDGHSAES